MNISPASSAPREVIRFCQDGRVLLMQPMTGPEMLASLVTALAANTNRLPDGGHTDCWTVDTEFHLPTCLCEWCKDAGTNGHTRP